MRKQQHDHGGGSPKTALQQYGTNLLQTRVTSVTLVKGDGPVLSPFFPLRPKFH